MPGNAIFINYRRADSGGYAGRLRDHLVAQFGRDRVFMDVGILGGEDWVAAIERALGASGAMLAIIGPNWSSSRLEDPRDRLRQELEAAMALGVEIIPVLVGDARMPRAGDLPPSIRDLPRQQAVRLTDEGWDDDVRRLIGRLTQIVGAGQSQASAVAPKSSPIVGCVVALIFLAIVAGIGFVAYQFVVNGPTGANAKITLSPTSGPPGTTVTVSGTGFPGSTDIEITLLGPAAETVSDSNGDFTTTFVVPDTPFTGIHDVFVTGGAFGDTAQFTIEGG
jgi:TIR domain/IPT/TIG domain